MTIRKTKIAEEAIGHAILIPCKDSEMLMRVGADKDGVWAWFNSNSDVKSLLGESHITIWVLEDVTCDESEYVVPNIASFWNTFIRNGKACHVFYAYGDLT